MARDRSAEFLTLGEVSARTGIPVRSLRRYAQGSQSRIPTVALERGQLYPREALEIFQAIRQEIQGRQRPARRTDLLTLAEVSRLTGLADSVLRRQVDRHLEQIPHQGEGRLRRFYPEAIPIFVRLVRQEREADLRRVPRTIGGRAADFEPEVASLIEEIAEEDIVIVPGLGRTSRAGDRTKGRGGRKQGAASARMARMEEVRRSRSRPKSKTEAPQVPTTPAEASAGDLEGIPPQDPGPKRRYANAVLLELEDDEPLDQSAAIAPGRTVRLRLDIGPWSERSQVSAPQPIDQHLPKKDLWLDVVTSSTDFAVATTRQVRAKSVARGRMFLPADCSAATTPQGEEHLDFFLRAPEEAGRARARVAFYYRQALVQSLLLEADVRPGLGAYRITVDYAISRSLGDLGAIPNRPRVSLLINDNGDETHQVVLRAGRSGRNRVDATSELESSAVGPQIATLRALLRNIAPQRRRRRKDEFERDLRELAPLGWKLYAALWRTLPALDREAEEPIIHVARPSTSSFTFPWSLLYDIPLDRDAVRLKEVPFCPIVEEWDGHSPLVHGEPRRCPAAAEVSHEDGNLLCPFGFWGYRRSIEQLSSRLDLGIEIPVPESFTMVMAKTQQVRNKKALRDHAQRLRATLQRRFPSAVLDEGDDKRSIHTLLGRDLPLVYFYCHGNRLRGDAHTYLGVGQDETLAAEDFIGWLVTWKRTESRTVWDQVRPLIFVNACHSVELQPEMLLSYQDAFVGSANAVGLIGTEVRVDQRLAMDVAERFFELFVEDGTTVDQALHRVRLELLTEGNLFGLVYTPYCWADLQLHATL